MAKTITPRLLKGFRDFLPQEEIKRKELVSILEETFKLFGFLPIDTPVLEYTEILLGKGGGETDKQIYRFNDHGKRDVAMRYDLTVPFARFMAQHRNQLYLPFRRYHIAKVWRGENTQRGRYREFTQCDFDIVGTDSVSSDFEILLLMHTSMLALGIENFKIHISDRSLFNRLLTILQIGERYTEILRLVDKLPKIGRETLQKSLEEIVDNKKAKTILAFTEAEGKTPGETIKNIRETLNLDERETLRVEEIWNIVEEMGLESYFKIDPSITRGLDYYTGVVFETFLNDLPQIGSVCSGGRYNNLTSLYTKESIPGVGASIGLDRLIAALDEINPGKSQIQIPQVLILFLDNRLIAHYHHISSHLRKNGISSEVYPEKKKFANQFSYAEKKGIPIGVICGEDEYREKTVTLKDLRTRQSYTGITIEELPDRIKQLLR